MSQINRIEQTIYGRLIALNGNHAVLTVPSGVDINCSVASFSDDERTALAARLDQWVGLIGFPEYQDVLDMAFLNAVKLSPYEDCTITAALAALGDVAAFAFATIDPDNLINDMRADTLGDDE